MIDVVLIGRGPTGLTMAALLGRLGHSVALVERHRDMYGLPRAGHVDHEIVRLLAALDAADAMLEDSYPTVEYTWVSAAGETLLDFDWGAKSISGYNSDFMQFQPLIESALDARLKASPTVEEFTGTECVGFVDRGDHVDVRLRRIAAPGSSSSGEETVLSARYLIAADGANSIVRRSLGISRRDLGFNEKWLVVDARKKREVKLDFDCGQICDPRRPVTILPLGRRHRRWEWAMMPGETVEELERPAFAWERLAEQGVGPDDVTIIRQLVYTFEARHAERFRSGRVFLVGDAAHTMPPFMGQGMCSGLRDAANLSWKLDLVLRGAAPDALLDTYERERSPHALDWTMISLEAGKVPCTLDPELARQRDELFKGGWLPPMPSFPKLTSGILHGAEGTAAAPVGELGLQARVRRDGRVGLLDGFFPPLTFTVISTVGRPELMLDLRQRAALASIGITYLHIGAQGDVGCDAEDVDGAYSDYLRAHGAEAVVVRPDFYVFGLAPHLADLPALVDDLLDQLAAEPAASARKAEVARSVA